MKGNYNMGHGVKNSLSFLFGAAVGTLITWQLSKTYYERINEEEIQSVKDRWRKKYAPEEESNDESPTERNVKSEDRLTVARRPNRTDYRSSYDADAKKDKIVQEGEPMQNKPFVIPPDEVGECDYETISLKYFNDGVLMDDATGEVISDVEELVGVSSLSTFGLYEEDSVFVRNDELECDYEILADDRSYKEYIEEHPYRRTK